MDLAALRSKIRRKFGRRDLTDALADDFANDGLLRALRLLHYPEDETSADLTADADGELTLPQDVRRIKTLLAPDGFPLRHTSLEDALIRRGTADVLTYWARRGSYLVTAAQAEAGSTFSLIYWPTKTLVADSDTHPVLEQAPDVVEYAAYEEAALAYHDYRRLPLFRETLAQRAKEAAGELTREKMVGYGLAIEVDEDL